MRVPARVLASESLLEEIKQDKSLEQLRNTTHLPGIQKYAIAMPDAHQGYGFPVGGVAGIDAENGCISPGAVGYDINCGVRMMRTNLTYDDLDGREEELVDSLFSNVPSGLGGGGVVESGIDTIEAILDRGMEWALEEGYAVPEDLAHCEDEGVRRDGDPSAVSQKAKDRGKNQIGSLGSGNHFLEVQRVTDVFREDVADSFGLEEDRIVVLIHTGSRGLGHQVCTDYLRRILSSPRSLAYLGPRRYARTGGIARLAEPWGWKDPRNTYTLPFWLDLFPDARVVHVYRHGVDVAASLHQRQRMSPHQLQRRLLKGVLGGVVMPRWGGFVDSWRCADLDQAVALWAEYIREARGHVASLGPRAMEIRYEALLEHPGPALSALARFCGLPADAAAGAADGMKSSRALAYRGDTSLRELAERWHTELSAFGY
jgi:hypothetical protein